MTKKTLHIIGALYFLAIYIFITFPPVVSMIDRIDPHILGLPCSQFCILFSAFAIAIGLMAMFLIEGKIDIRDNAKEEGGEAK